MSEPSREIRIEVFRYRPELFDELAVCDPELVRLCTVRMVRKLAPVLRHRNLDVVARHFGVRIHDRHRAYGDALATARVFLRLLDEAKVTVTPGRAFGPAGEHHVRMAYCVDEATIDAAFDRIEEHFGR